MKALSLFGLLFNWGGQQEAPLADEVAKLITDRHSGYEYDVSRQVTMPQIRSLMHAAHLAPSSYNDQPWRFIICDKVTDPKAYDKVFSTLVEFNQNWAKNAQVLVVVIAATNSREGQENKWAQYDTGAAAYALMLQATSLGLMAHQMAGFDVDQLRKLFNISDEFVPLSVMAIGYEVQEPTKARQRERHPMSDHFFMGSWKNK